jgi:transketolase
MTARGFAAPALDDADVAALAERARILRGAVITMTTLAGSGHPGGSFSSMELYQVLYNYANLRPGEPGWPARDRVFVSHGHTSPGAYVTLADAGFFDLQDAVAHFRQAGSIFEGHVERSVPGIEWSTGNLGQGLSAADGAVLAQRLTGGAWHTYVAMSDAEQMKGQVGEARRLAAKYRLCELTVAVDLNRAQISGHTTEVMPVDVAADFAADGWGVIECDGHDTAALYDALHRARADRDRPYAVLAHTFIGHGVSFMEDDPAYHGRALTADEYVRAMAELDLDPDWLERARELRASAPATPAAARPLPVCARSTGAPRSYDTASDCRSAWGNALADLAEVDPATPMAVFDCDLMGSVKTAGFLKARPEAFVECGVGEHNAATAAASCSTNGVLTFWADFGVFGLDEAYNQQRLADINHASLKLVLTHCGLDVGEDGRTHQCVDYVGALRSMFGWRVIVPADANQTDRAVRAAAGMPGCVAIAMGRSPLLPVLDQAGRPAFGGDHTFRYGAIDILRDGGSEAAVLAMGTLSGAAVEAVDAVRCDGLSVSAAIVSCPLDLDDEAMVMLAASPVIVTVEDHSVRSGLAASVAEWLAARGSGTRLVALGVRGYASSGTPGALFAAAGLDADGIEESIRRAIRG